MTTEAQDILQLQNQVKELRAWLRLKEPKLWWADLTDGVGSNMGTAFPTSPAPATGMLYFRKDLGLLCYYSGSNWRTVHEYSIGVPLLAEQTSDGQSGAIPLRVDYSPYFTRGEIISRVLTPNDATNFWYLYVNGVNLAMSNGASICAFNTASDTANAMTRHSGIDTAAPSYKDSVQMVWSKNNSPGTLRMMASVFYRLIIP